MCARGAARPTGLAAAVALAVLLSSCSPGPQDVMATPTCPDPLHRVLVAAPSPGAGSEGGGGAATPSPPTDPARQHRFTAAATFHPDDDPSTALPVTVTADDGTGRGATEAEACQVLVLQLALDAGELSTPYGQVEPGRLQVADDDGAGSVRLVDQPTHIRDADDGSGAQDYGEVTGWYALVEDPVAGTYRTQRTVRWEPVPHPVASDDGAARHDDAAPAGAGTSLTGTVDLEITIG